MFIQLYLRSGQFDTSLSRVTCLRDDQQPWCRFGCQTFEDPHYIFTIWSHLSSLRVSRALELRSSCDRILQTFSVPSPDRTFVLDRLRSLYITWEIFHASSPTPSINLVFTRDWHTNVTLSLPGWPLRSGLLSIVPFILNLTLHLAHVIL